MEVAGLAGPSGGGQRPSGLIKSGTAGGRENNDPGYVFSDTRPTGGMVIDGADLTL